MTTMGQDDRKFPSYRRHGGQDLRGVLPRLMTPAPG